AAAGRLVPQRSSRQDLERNGAVQPPVPPPIHHPPAAGAQLLGEAGGGGSLAEERVRFRQRGAILSWDKQARQPNCAVTTRIRGHIRSSGWLTGKSER